MDKGRILDVMYYTGALLIPVVYLFLSWSPKKTVLIQILMLITLASLGGELILPAS